MKCNFRTLRSNNTAKNCLAKYGVFFLGIIDLAVGLGVGVVAAVDCADAGGSFA